MKAKGFNVLVWAMGVALMMAAGGCIAVHDESTDTGPKTLGRELRDLKTAREKGAITDEEYAVAKKKLLS